MAHIETGIYPCRKNKEALQTLERERRQPNGEKENQGSRVTEVKKIVFQEGGRRQPAVMAIGGENRQ